MPAPQNYMLNLPDPSQQVMGKVATGLNIAGAKQGLDKGRAEQEQQQMLNQRLSELSAMQNPTAQDYVSLANMLPKDQADSLRASWEALNKDQQQSQLNFSGKVLGAFQSGSPEMAVNLLRERAEAERNSGREDQAKSYEDWAKIAETNPDIAKKTIGTMVAAIPGGDKIINSLDKMSGQGYRAQEIDIEKQKLGLRKNENQLRAMESALKRETNELKRQQLQQKIEEKRQKIDQDKREMVSGSEVAVQNTSNAVELVSDILDNVDLDSITGLSSLMPTVKPSTQDDLNKITQLKNQLTLDNLKMMTGVLTDRDIQVLSSAASGLVVDEDGVKGSKEGVRKQLQKIQSTLKEKLGKASKGLNTLKEKYGEPEQDTPANTEQTKNIVVDY